MVITLNKILILAVFISILMTSCTNTKDFSISNPDIQKLTQKAQKLIEKGQYKAAIGRLESINDLNPDLSENYYNLGIVYYKDKQYQKALESLEKAVALDKEFENAYYTTAVIYEDKALQKTEELDKIKNDKEKAVNAIVEIKNDYENSRDAFVTYLKYKEEYKDTDESRQNIFEKIKELNKEIKTYEQKFESESKK